MDVLMRWLYFAGALSAFYLLEPKPIYLDGVAPRDVRYERVERRPLSSSLIGAPARTVVGWP